MPVAFPPHSATVAVSPADSADPTAPIRLEWTPAARHRFWAWERNFPEHYFSRKYGGALVQAMRRYVKEDHCVLDYACGLGFLSLRLTRVCRAEVWATDEAAQAVELTAIRNAGHRHFRSSMTIDVLLDHGVQFDRVIAVELIEHLDDTQLSLFFHRVDRLLKPDGLLIVTTPNNEHLDRKMVLCPNCNHIFHRWQHVRSVSSGTLARLSREHGFRPRSVVETSFSQRGLVGYVLRRHPTLIPSFIAPRPHLFGVLEKQSGMPDR
jgi:2-polyprenyl-3-methyl-5-hydroxy-6-metoxy-1,4-benzoquinol methylase